LRQVIGEAGKTRIPAGAIRCACAARAGFRRRFSKARTWRHRLIQIIPGAWCCVLSHVGNRHRDAPGCVVEGANRFQNKKDGRVIMESIMSYARIYPVLPACAKAGRRLRVRYEHQRTHAGMAP